MGSAVEEVFSDFDSCSGFWMIRSLPVVTDHEKLTAALRMRFSDNGPAKGKRLRLSDFSEEAAWNRHVGKDATTRGEGLLLRALEGLQKFLVVFFGSAYKDCLRPFCDVFTRVGQPMVKFHDVFVEYTLLEAFSQLGSDLASVSSSLSSFPGASRASMSGCVALFRAYGERWAFRMDIRQYPSVEVLQAGGFLAPGSLVADTACLLRVQQGWSAFNPIPHGGFYACNGPYESFVKKQGALPAVVTPLVVRPTRSVAPKPVAAALVLPPPDAVCVFQAAHLLGLKDKNDVVIECRRGTSCPRKHVRSAAEVRTLLSKLDGNVAVLLQVKKACA